MRLVRDGDESKSESRREGVDGVEDTCSAIIGVLELWFVKPDDRGEVWLKTGGAKVDQTGTGTGATTSGDGTAMEEEIERVESRRESPKLIGKAESGGEFRAEGFANGERGRLGVEGRHIAGGGEAGGEIDVRVEPRGDLRGSEGSYAPRDPVGAFDED